MKDETTSSNPTQDDGKPDMSKPVTDSVEDIVSKAAKAISTGKSFGGWTDQVEETIGNTMSRVRAMAKNQENRQKTPAVLTGNPGARVRKEKQRKTDKPGPNVIVRTGQGSYVKDTTSESNEINEIAFLAPLAGMAARWVGSKAVKGLAKKALRHGVSSAVQNAATPKPPDETQEGIVGSALRAAGRYAKKNPLEAGYAAMTVGRAIKNKMAERKARRQQQQQGNPNV